MVAHLASQPATFSVRAPDDKGRPEGARCISPGPVRH